MKYSRAMLPNCEVCGRFLNPLKEEHYSEAIYDWEKISVLREAYYHKNCWVKKTIEYDARIDTYPYPPYK